MTAFKHKKGKRRDSKKIKISFLKLVPFILCILIVFFLIYRIIDLISFKVESSNISTEMLSTNNSLINNLFVFEQEGKIVNIEAIIYSKDQEKILKVNLPTAIYVNYPGVDSFPISSVSSVGEFLNHGSGKEFTVKYISNLLGLKFDNYVWLTNSSTSTDQFLSKLSILSILFDFQFNHELRGNLYSNLPIVNLMNEVSFINQSKSNYQYEEMDILDCCVEQRTVSGDRKEVRFYSRTFDEEFSKYIKELVNRDVQRERVNVEVYNASDESGLASEYARKIRHTGCRILRYDNAPSIYSNTVIYIPEPEGYFNSLDLVRDVVGDSVKIRHERPAFITTGDIVVVLGTDLIK